MISDAQVKEVALLREYASRLNMFKDVILAGCAGMISKSESIKDDIQTISKQVNNQLSRGSNEAEQVIRNYNDIVERYHLTSLNSSLLGTTATDAKSKLEQLNKCTEEINSKITNIRSLLTGLEERTAAYTIAIRSMTGNGYEQLRKRCDILDKYKEQQG